jgi:hypothetical protein
MDVYRGPAGMRALKANAAGRKGVFRERERERE